MKNCMQDFSPLTRRLDAARRRAVVVNLSIEVGTCLVAAAMLVFPLLW